MGSALGIGWTVERIGGVRNYFELWELEYLLVTSKKNCIFAPYNVPYLENEIIPYLFNTTHLEL